MKKKNVFVNETTYLKKCKSFLMLSSHIILNENLTDSEIGLMARLLYNDETFVINKTYQQEKSGKSVNCFNKSWKILENEGYISSKKEQTPKGFKYIYIISNTPISKVDKPLKHKPKNKSEETPPSDSQGWETQVWKTQDLPPTSGKPRSGEACLNKDIKNIELNKKEISNKDKINLEVTNEGKIVERIEENLNMDNNLVKIDGKLIIDDISSSTLSEGIDDIENTSMSFDISKDTSTMFEPALVQVQNKKEQKNFSSMQDEVKHKLREYVIKNKILPELVKEDIELMYSIKTFIDNTENFNTEELYQYAVKNSGINSYIGTASPSSIQNKLLKMADHYIKENNLDPIDAKKRMNNYFSYFYNNEKFYRIKQDDNLDLQFQYLLMYTKLRSANKLITN